MKKVNIELTNNQKAELQALQDLPDDEIDTTDAREILDWSNSKRGVFYRAVKQQITLRLDADIVDWFRSNAKGGRGYQTDMNRVLREHAERYGSMESAENAGATLEPPSVPGALSGDKPRLVCGPPP